MKHTIGKAGRLLAVLLGAMLLTLGTCAGVWAEEPDEDVRIQLETTGEGLTDTIIELSDEAVAQYSNSSDSFTASAMEAWAGSKEELGALVPDAENGEVSVSQRGTKYTVSVPRTFENATANFVYVFDKTLNPSSITIDVKLPMSVNLSRAGLNTLMGICTVFLVLVFLSFIISLLKFVPGFFEKKKETAPVPAPVPVPAAPAPAAEEEYVDDQELVAVIAAAIAAAEGTSADGFVVRSIRKAARRR